MGAPSIYVYDCSCAGLIVESFKQFAAQHEREYEIFVTNSKTSSDSPPMPLYKTCIQLAACGAQQILPMNPELPADLFTSCLTTPVKTAVTWFVLQNNRKLVPDITMEQIDKIPGMLNDRRTMLGELNWIFTAITDTIAWNVLPKDMFQRLFRQDLLVASLFRNFLLAERIMRSYNCNPVSDPSLPLTHHHPMWQAWDLAVDICLAQLPYVTKSPPDPYVQSLFFSEQLTAFQVWLSYGFDGRSVPEQLPIVLQVLLSQVHRLRALELLGRFLDLGPWAVNLALSVGIFPYVLKLLQSSARELRPLLVFIWAKVLAVDSTCQNDLVRDGGYKYFLCILGDTYMSAHHRTMAAFSVACIVRNYHGGQLAALQGNVISICLEQLADPYAKLRQWVAICLGCTWANFEQARWCGVRDSAHEKLYTLLSDPEPEVRACAIYALGKFLNSTSERTDHSNAIDHNIGMTLINEVANDGSPLVRMELVAALQWFLLIFENQFVAVAYQCREEEERAKDFHANKYLSPNGETPTGVRKATSRDRLKTPLSSSPVSSVLESSGDGAGMIQLERMRKVSSSASLCSLSGLNQHSSLPFVSSTLGYASVFANIWQTLIALCCDPYPDVAECAKQLINYIKEKVDRIHGFDSAKSKKVSSVSEPSSPSGKPNYLNSEFPPSRQHEESPQEGARGTKGLHRWADTNPAYQQYQYFAQFHRIRRTFDRGPEIRENGEDAGNQQEPKSAVVETNLFAWCSKYFCQPVIKLCENDTESDSYLSKEWRFLRNGCIRKNIEVEKKLLEASKLDEQVFINKNPNRPSIVKFHPFDPHLIVADKDSYSVWDWESATQLCHHNSHSPLNVRITTIDLLNSHDDTLLMIGSDDGALRIWKNYATEPELITGFQILHDLRPITKGSGLVVQWEQHSSQILASGDSRLIRIWDANKEMKIQDIPTGSDSCVTCISTHPACPNFIVVGCGNGSVRAYDRRLPPSESNIRIYSDHSGWVVNSTLKCNMASSESLIISGSVAGDVRISGLTHATSKEHLPPSHGMTTMTVHPNLDLIACGAATQFISVYNHEGVSLSTIKYHDGFMSHRIGPISCLAFHPYKATLAAGSTDSVVSVYSVRREL